MARDFVEDLRKASVKAAEFLREKNSVLRQSGLDNSLYTSEKQFVAEIYRLMVRTNKRYRSTLLIEYHRPRVNDRVFEGAHPDIAYYDSEGNKFAVEVKGVWFLTEEGSVYQADIKRIVDDFDRLQGEWGRFDQKVLVVSFLGDNAKFKRNKFQNSVLALTRGEAGISLITC